MSRNKVLQSLLVILVFLCALYGRRLFHLTGLVSFDSPVLKMIYSYSWWVIPTTVAVGALYGFKNVLKEFCLDKRMLFGLAFSLLATSPMLISSAVLGTLDADIDLLMLLKKTLFAGFMEEFLFRGFLFGILFRKLGWGFIPASAIGATIFGLSHLYQGSGVGQLVGIFSITFIGSAWFAWLFIEWKENLWIPIFLHGFMNLSWTLFNMSDNALGDTYSNIFRVATIALTVIATIEYNKRKDKFRINKSNLLVDKSKQS